jgi:UDP:flavonoid glycosyltransferase YjiC (YdhE family)
MATILVAPAMFSGHLLPHLAVAQALRRLGHHVVVYAETEAESLVRASDCEFEPMPCGDAREAFARAETLDAAVAAFSEVAERSAPPLVDLVARRGVERALVDSFHLGAALAVERCGIPWATLATTPSESQPGFADSPIHRVPSASLRERLGLAPSARTSYQQTCSPSLFLQPWTAEFDGGVKVAAAHSIGPLGWNDPPASVPSWIRDDDGRPLIVVTVSSWSIDALAPYVQDYLHAACEAIGQLPARGLIGLGPFEPPPRVPDNVRLERFVPHSVVVPRARAVVTHGGWGSVSRGLIAGVPMIVELCERAGVGIYVPSELVSADSLGAILGELLSETDGHHRAARELAARIGDLAPAETAARALLALRVPPEPPAARSS